MLSDSEFHIPLYYEDLSFLHCVSDEVVRELSLHQLHPSTNHPELVCMYTSSPLTLRENQQLLHYSSIPNLLLSWTPPSPSSVAEYTMPLASLFHHAPLWLYMNGMYTLTSPLLTLLTLCLVFLGPLLWVWYQQRTTCTWDTYLPVLRQLSGYHPLAKLCTSNLRTATQDQWMSVCIPVLMYVWNMYTSSTTSYSLWNHLSHVRSELVVYATRLQHLQNLAQTYVEITASFVSVPHVRFRDCLQSHLQTATTMCAQLTHALSGHFGHRIRCMHEWMHNPLWKETMYYLTSFSEYVTQLHVLRTVLQPAVLSETATSYSVTGMWTNAAPTPQQATLTLDKPMLLTGPNASGKTSLLTTLFCNVLLSQQWGSGWYVGTSSVIPMNHLYTRLCCYINVPSSSQVTRDSLFQAEARLCKEMLENANSNTNTKSLYLFDELFSCTNAKDAEHSAEMVLQEVLDHMSSLTFVISTHFHGLCKKYKTKQVQSWCMETTGDPTSYQVTYQVIPGVSLVCGAYTVFRTMNYPTSFLDRWMRTVACKKKKKKTKTKTKTNQEKELE